VVPFQRFFEQHRESVWRYCAAVVGPSHADDVFQETFLAALRAYDRRRAGASGSAWVLTIAHNKAMDHHRGVGRRALPLEELPEIAHHDPEPALDAGPWARVRTLPAKQRAALTLRYAAGLSHAEVARARLLGGGRAALGPRGTQDPETGAHPMTPLDAPDTDPKALAAASARLLVAAAAEADVVYAELDSPVGRIVAAATPKGLARLAYRDVNGGLDAILEGLAARLSPRIVEAPARLDAVRRELDEYFTGTRRSFDLPVDLGLVAPFGRAVLEACARIPFGATASYRAVAAEAGRPSASRAAGNALGANPVPIVVPCHRVLRTGGGIGGYTGGLAIKEHLLTLEGVRP